MKTLLALALFATAAVAAPPFEVPPGQNKGAVTVENAASANALQGQAQKQNQKQSQSTYSSNRNLNRNNSSGGSAQGGNVSINQPAVDLRDTVPTVFSPGLTTTMTETCMGSTSGSLAVAGFGAGLGSTWTDSACVRRLDARQLHALGYTAVAAELMCQSDTVRRAFLSSGIKCGGESLFPQELEDEKNEDVGFVIK